jgi:hypothetical protein
MSSQGPDDLKVGKFVSGKILFSASQRASEKASTIHHCNALDKMVAATTTLLVGIDVGMTCTGEKQASLVFHAD